jgi:hypothetical protein
MKFSMLALTATVLSAGVNGFAGVGPKTMARSFAANPSALKMSTAVETDKKAALATAANEARGLAMDSIAAAHSGHMGLPLGCAEAGAVLYGSQVRHYSEITGTADLLALVTKNSRSLINPIFALFS